MSTVPSTQTNKILGVVMLVAQRCHRWRWIAWPFGMLSLGLFCYALMVPSSSGAYLSVSLVGLLWSMLFYILTALFVKIPVIEAEMGWLKRLRVRVLRGGLTLLAVLFIVLNLSILSLSHKLFTVANDEQRSEIEPPLLDDSK